VPTVGSADMTGWTAQSASGGAGRCRDPWTCLAAGPPGL